MLAPINESKEKIKKYEELWIKIRDLNKTMTKSADDYDKTIWNSNLIQLAIYF